jgi:hypothetical protein
MTPVAVFAYNRPTHLGRLLESLARCARLEECAVTIYCDGPKNVDAASAVAETRQVALAWASIHNAKVVEREENRGLAGSIAGTVTELCAAHGRVIVLEDDFILAPDFLNYMLQALDRYADEPEVMQVSGFMFPVEHTTPQDAIFLSTTVTWGWATWQRAWSRFDPNPAGALEALDADPNLRAAFDLYGDDRFYTMLRDRLNGANQSWGILWYWAVFRARGRVLHPRTSLLRVEGFDGSGVHCGPGSGFEQEAAERFLEPRLPALSLPDNIRVDAQAQATLVTFMARGRGGGGLPGAVRRVLGWFKERAGVRG